MSSNAEAYPKFSQVFIRMFLTVTAVLYCPSPSPSPSPSPHYLRMHVVLLAMYEEFLAILWYALSILSISWLVSSIDSLCLLLAREV